MNPIASLPKPASIELPDGGVANLRPVAPADATAEREFVAKLSPGARHNRFHGAVNGLSEAMARYLTCVDQCRHVAFVLTLDVGGREAVIGDARYVVGDDGESAEFAIAVADGWQGCGLAHRLLDALVACARARGLRWLTADVLATNVRMLGLAERLGFARSARGVVDGAVRIERAVEKGPATVPAGDRSAGRFATFLSLVRRWTAPRPNQPAHFLAPF